MKKIVYVLCGFLFFSCMTKEKDFPTNFDYGSIENGIYENDFFRMKVPIPDNWHVQNKEQMNDIIESGSEIMAGDNKALKKTFDASQINVAQLLMVFKNELTSVNTFNASIVVNAENLKNFPSVKTTQDYLSQARKILDQTQLNLVYEKEEYKKFIGNKEFIGLDVRNADYGIYQNYYVTLINGFAINIVLSYETEEDKKTLHSILEQIKINKHL